MSTEYHRDSEEGEQGRKKSTGEDSDIDMRQYYMPYGGAPDGPAPIRRDFIDSMFTYINKDLLICKVFYFFFFAAFGSLFPLLAVYFKQLAMNPIQAGLLIGFRPFVEFVSGPFWGGIADRYKRWKGMLLIAVVCWIVFTFAMAFVKPPAKACFAYNNTQLILVEPYAYKRHIQISSHQRGKRSAENLPEYADVLVNRHNYDCHHCRNKRAIGESPFPISSAIVSNYDEHDVKGLVSPPFTHIVYETGDVEHAFFGLLLLVIIGEFFAAPAITLVDSLTLTILGDDTDNYGRQRMFGSIGWGLAMFFVGLALDHSTSFPDHPCQTRDIGEKNYIICFTVFSVLMCFAFIAATQLRFIFEGQPPPIQFFTLTARAKDKVREWITGQKRVDRVKLVDEGDNIDYYAAEHQHSQYRNGEPEKDHTDQDGVAGVAGDQTNGKKLHITLKHQQDMVSDAVKPGQYPPQQLPANVQVNPNAFFGKWLAVLKILANWKYIPILFVAWFMGFGIGIIFTFLFWHLQDLDGTPTLFGIASVFNHISELVAYFLTRKVIAAYGHITVLYAGLLGNVCRFLYISWLRNPWWVLPFELVQGLTHAAVWAACCSYITQAIPPQLRNSSQGIMQGLHHGLGRGCGAVIGGILVHTYGSEVTFRTYGIVCVFVLVAFIITNYCIYGRQHLFSFRQHEPHQILEETSHLAPHGVPSNPITRSNLSSSRLADLTDRQDGYGTTADNSGPFLQPGPQRDPPANSYQSGPVGGYAGGNPFTGPFAGVEPPANQRVVMGQPPGMRTELHQQQPENKINPLFDYAH